MDIRPILSTLLRHKTAAALIVLEIAISCAIICNALFLIEQRYQRMDRPTGQVDNELVRVQVTGIGQGTDNKALTRADLASLRALPGVTAATVTNQVTFGSSSWSSGVNMAPGQQASVLSASTYFGDEHYLATTGLNLVAGRAFTADEYVSWEQLNAPDGGVSAAIVSQTMARRLFPDGNALGQSIYVWGDNPTRIVGIVDTLVRPNDNGPDEGHGNAMLLPVHMTTGGGSSYLLRTEPELRAQVLEAAIKAVEANSASRIVLTDQSTTMQKMREDFYAQDRAMVWLLVAVSIALLVVTALGIVGLASFWVAQRTKQIGVRRALGATRGQVLRYFQTENFLLATVGIVLGMLMAYGINLLLMDRYELPRLPAMYLPVGALALWVLGQVAVFGPARKAASVPPAVATRSV